MKAQRDIGALPLDIVDTPRLSVTEIASLVRARFKSLKTRLVVIDHLHRISPPTHMRTSPRFDQVRYIAESLKDLARSLDLPIIALAQLSKDRRRRSDSRPVMGDIEYIPDREADNIILCWQPGLELGPAPVDEDYKSADLAATARSEWHRRKTFWTNKVEVIAAKRRFGVVGDVKLFFDGATMRLSNLEGSG